MNLFKTLATNANIFDIPSDAAEDHTIVNPVNCVGVMGGGLAAVFKHKLEGTDYFSSYESACSKEEMRLGNCRIWEVPELAKDHFDFKYIIDFPTKDHWKSSSTIDMVSRGLVSLQYLQITHKISSLAIPRLGCGLGGLDWNLVRPMIYHQFDDSRGPWTKFSNSHTCMIYLWK